MNYVSFFILNEKRPAHCQEANNKKKKRKSDTIPKSPPKKIFWREKSDTIPKTAYAGQKETNKNDDNITLPSCLNPSEPQPHTCVASFTMQIVYTYIYAHSGNAQSTP